MSNDGGITKVIPMAVARLKNAVAAGIPFAPRVASMKQLPIKDVASNLIYVRTDTGEDHFTLVLNVGTLNFSLRDASAQDAMHANYQALLNNLPWPVQWRFSVRRVDPAALVRPIERRMAETKDERVHQWLADQLGHINNLVSTNDIPYARLLLAVPMVPPPGLRLAQRLEWARKEAEQRLPIIRNAIRAIGVDCERHRDVGGLLWEELNPELVGVTTPPGLGSLITFGTSMNTIDSTPFNYPADPLSPGEHASQSRYAPEELTFQKWYVEMGRRYRSVLLAQVWPSYLVPNALRHLTNSNLNLDVSLHITPFETAEVLRFLEQRLSMLTYSHTKDTIEGYTPDGKVVKFIEQARYCRDALEQGKARWFMTALYVGVTADSLAQLDQDVKVVQNLLGRSNIQAVPAYRQQKEALWALMPLGLDQVKAQRNMLTDAVANLAPFDCQQFLHEGGFYAGTSRLNGSLVALNVWNLDNYNLIALGLPGKGKTMWERHKITYHHCLSDDHQIIGDPDGEMDGMVRELGGEVIRLGASSPHRINLMDLALDWEGGDHRKGRPLDKKINLITEWLEHQIAEAGGDGVRRFAPVQKARVMHAIVRAYGRFGITMENQADILRDGRLVEMPVLDDLREELESVEPDLAEAMEIFTVGAMRIFNARTNVDVHNRLVSLNLRDLDPATRELAMPWIVGWMWGRVGINRFRKVHTHLYFEEVLYFLAHPVAAEYVSMIWTRGRKWWCSPCAVSQLVFRLLDTSVGRTVVKTSDLKVLFDQGDALEDVVRECGLSPAEAGFIRGSRPGHGLYVIGPWRVPFDLRLSPYQYEWYSTRPGEMRE